MRGNFFFVRMSVSALMVGLVIGGTIWAAEPPPLDITASSIAGGLSSQQSLQIEERLKHWRDQIANATAPREVIEARTGIRNDYSLVPTIEYQDEFARKGADILTPLLGGRSKPNNKPLLKPDDKLLLFKQVNVSIALSKMPQVTIQPALEVLVNHSSSPVRYLGWKGYQSVRTFVMAQSPLDARNMFRALKAAAGKEAAAPVIGAIFEMCEIFPSGGAAIPPATLKDARNNAAEIIRTNWSQWSGRIATGDVEMTRAFDNGVKTVKTLTPPNTDPSETGKSLQLLVDLMWCAAEAYDATDGEGIIGKENADLLKQCEAALNGLSQKRKDYINEALTAKKHEADRGAAVLRFVLKWAGDLKEFGVTNPETVIPTTRPTTIPPAPEAS